MPFDYITQGPPTGPVPFSPATLLDDVNNNLYISTRSSLSTPGKWQIVGGTSGVSKTIYVDGTRTDSYTATGSNLLPFKTITAAINQIITNGDNNTYPYVINISPFTYVENVDLGNANLFNLYLNGGGQAGSAAASTGTQMPGVVINPASGNALQSLSNNDQLAVLQISGITFQKAVSITDTVGSNLGILGFAFVDCTFFKNVNISGNSGTMDVEFINCSIMPVNTFSLNNIGMNWINSDMNAGTCTLTTSNGGLTLIELVNWAFNPATFTIGNNCRVTVQNALNVGGFGGTSIVIQNGGQLTNYGGIITSNITVNSGGTYTNKTGTIFTDGGRLSNSGTYSSTGLFQVSTIVEDTTLSPTSASTAGITGQIAWDSGFIYVCTVGGIAGSATWKKAALSAA